MDPSCYCCQPKPCPDVIQAQPLPLKTTDLEAALQQFSKLSTNSTPVKGNHLLGDYQQRVDISPHKARIARRTLHCDLYKDSAYFSRLFGTVEEGSWSTPSALTARKLEKSHQGSLSGSGSNSSSKENDDRSSFSWDGDDEYMDLSTPSKWTSSVRAGRSRHRVRKPYESSWRKKMGDRVRTFSFTFTLDDDSSRESSSYNRSNPGSPEKLNQDKHVRSKSLDNLQTAIKEEELINTVTYSFDLESMSKQLNDLKV